MKNALDVIFVVFILLGVILVLFSTVPPEALFRMEKKEISYTVQCPEFAQALDKALKEIRP